MGCGQSKIHLYPRKSKSKTNGKKSGHTDADADADEDEGHISNDNEKDINKDKERIEDDALLDDQGSPDQPNNEISISLLRAKNLSLLQSQEISSSQQNFFRMLDQKIEDGPDYDSSSETEMALEEARLNALVQHWESASLTASSLCSSTSRSLQGTPVRQTIMRPQDQQQQQQQQCGIASVRIIGGSTINAATRQRPATVTVGNTSVGMASTNQNIAGNRLPQHVPISYYTHSAPQTSYFNDVLHPMQDQQQQQQQPQQQQQQPQPPPLQQPQLHQQQQQQQPRFPPAISVQRLAPQVQRQIRETQELIKDSCPQLYAAGYGSPGPGPPMRTQPRQPTRRPTLETQFSREQELS